MMIPETPIPWKLRAPCQHCGGTEGTICKTGPNNVVRCANPRCPAKSRWQSIGPMLYCASKVETGEEPRSIERGRTGLTISKRAKILERDGNRCQSCGRTPRHGSILHVGHVLSVKDGIEFGATELEINDDLNLVTLCEACNLGQGARSMEPRTALRLIRAALAYIERQKKGRP